MFASSIISVPNQVVIKELNIDNEMAILDDEDIDILQDDEISHARYGVIICQQNLLFDKTILCEAAIKSDIMNELTSQVVEGRKLAEQAGN